MWKLALALLTIATSTSTAFAQTPSRKTVVDIRGQTFLVNGKPTYEGRTWKGHKIEGLLLNARMVQGAFEDRNPETQPLWTYPDGRAFDPDRNTREFIAAMPEWRRRGLISFTLNFQGGSPQGYSDKQPWINSAFDFEDGSLRPEYAARLEKILDKADELGMAPIVGILYFGQEPKFKDERAAVRAVDEATDWLLSKGYTNVLVEIANECDVRYKHEPVQPRRVHELIRRVQERGKGKVRNAAGRLLVSVSYGGGTIPGEGVVEVADFLLLHGNGVEGTDKIREMVERTRRLKSYRGQPVLFNEDDHFDFDLPDNHFIAAVSQYAGWGYFDFRMKGEGFDEGYQSVPVNWSISSARKRGFFKLLEEMAGAKGK
jgi:hypothetical protein